METVDQRDIIVENVKKEFESMIQDGRIARSSFDTPPTPQTEEADAAPQGGQDAKGTTPNATPAAEATPATSTERKYAGKYDDLETFESSHWQLTNYASKLADTNTQLKEEIARLKSLGLPEMLPGSSPGADARVNPAARTPSTDWSKDEALRKLAEDTGADIDFLSKLAGTIADRVAYSATQEVENRLAPMREEAKAEAYMRSHYPQSFNYLPEMELFLHANDEVKGTAKALYDSGRYQDSMVYVWKMFEADGKKVAQERIKANSKETETDRKSARAAVGLPAKSPGTPVHTAQQGNETDQAELERIAQAARDGDHYAQVAYRNLFTQNLLSNDPAFQRAAEVPPWARR